MQLVLRMERRDPPSWHRALSPRRRPAPRRSASTRAATRAASGTTRSATTAAATSARSPGGPGPAHWAAAQDLPGITVDDRRDRRCGSLVPGLVDRAGPADLAGCRSAAPTCPSTSRRSRRDRGPTGATCRLWVPAAIGDDLGKAMAQAGHAGMIMAALLTGDGEAGRARAAAVARRAAAR